MPKRTNAYQKLILHISHQLNSEDCSIEESKMLWDAQSEQDREVDIFIEGQAGAYPFSIGIECTSKKNKIGIKEIEQIHQKHKNIGVGRTVIVSESGFVSKGHTYAKKNNLDLITFDSAFNMDWPLWLKDFQGSLLTYFSFEPLDVQVVIENSSQQEFKITKDLYVQSNDLGELDVNRFVYEYYRLKYSSNTQGKKRIETRVWNFSPPMPIINSLGAKALCPTMTVKYSCIQTKVGMNYSEFNGKPIMHGLSETESHFKYVGMTASPSGDSTDDGKPKFNITIHMDTD